MAGGGRIIGGMLAKLHIIVAKNTADLWEAHILEANCQPRAQGGTLTALLKELYMLIATHLDSARLLRREPFQVASASAEIKAAFDRAQTSLEWLNPPPWADQLPTLEIRCIG